MNPRPGPLRLLLWMALLLMAPLWMAPLWMAPPWMAVAQPLPAAPAPLAFREVLVVGTCLRLSVESHRPREIGVDATDWVTLRVENGCPFALRHLQVALVLVDPEGGFFGAPLWVLGAGVMLPPGRSLRERFPVANPEQKIPAGWHLRVVGAEGLGPGGWRPLTPETPAS